MKKMSIYEKLKNFWDKRNLLNRTAHTTNKDWGKVSAGKGGETLTASIDPHAFKKECELYDAGKLPFEHEPYRGQAMEVVK